MYNKIVCLFSAPYTFLSIKDNFKIKNIKFILNEIWKKKHLRYYKNVSAWIVNPGQNFIIDNNILKYFPKLKVIITPSTGVNHINKEECLKKNVKVFSLLENKKELKHIHASSEYTFLMILNSFRRFDRAIEEIDNERWRDRENFLRGEEIYSKKIGLIGLGRIGSNLGKWLKLFGAEVSYYDPFSNSKNFKKKSLAKIFEYSNLICICCTLNKNTKHMININLLKKLKKKAILVNTSRGEIINEADLIKFLKIREDIFYTADVMSNETTGKQFNSKLIKLHKKRRILLSPHIAGATIESQVKAAKISIQILKKFFTK